MWKGTPVIGGNVGGIRYQIDSGKNGFLVSIVDEAAERIVEILRDRALREKLGACAKETVRQKFLLTRNLEEYLDLFAAFQTEFRLASQPAAGVAGVADVDRGNATRPSERA
jgi:trehalose synthase